MTSPPQRPRHEEGPDAEGGHPGVDEVDALLDADLARVRDREGSDGPPPEALVAAHVLGCTRCQDVLADLRGVRGLLRARAAGAPAPPADLQARIAAAVADDASRERRESRRRHRRTALALAASGVLVAGLGTAVALSAGPVLGGGAADSAGSAAGAAAGGGGAQDDGGGTPPSPVVMASGTDYAPGLVAAQLDAAVAGTSAASGDAGGSASPPSPGGGSGGGGETGGGAPGTSPDRGEGRAPGAQEAPVPEAAPTQPGSLSDAARLQRCLSELGRPGASVLVVDTARWQGEPADVLVLPTPGEQDEVGPGGSVLGRPVQVWVVAPGCAGGEQGLRHFEVLG